MANKIVVLATLGVLTCSVLETAAQCTVPQTELGVFLVYMKGDDCTVLANNSALSGVSRIGCFTVYNGTQQPTWYNIYNFPVEVSNDTAKVVRQEHISPNGTELVFTSFAASFHTGIYECKVVDKNNESQTLLLGLYAAIGAPILTANATFQLMSSYPQLVFSLTCSTTGYPPTIVSLSRDNDQLDLSSEQWTALQELTNRPETDYTSTLMLNTSDTAGYAGTYNFTLSNTGGSTFSTISLIAPEPPTSLKVTITGMTTSLSWKHTEENVKHYRIYIEQLGLNVETESLSYSSLVLDNQTAYNISVVAVYDLPSIPGLLLIQTGVPEIPKGLNSTTINSTSIMLIWSSSIVLVSRYTLTTIYNNSCTQNTSQTILSEVTNNDASETVHYRTGLQPDAYYCFMLMATNPWGNSSQSETTCTHTPPVAPDTSPGIVNITKSAENISFSLVPLLCLEQKGQLQHYIVQHVEKIGEADCSHVDSLNQTFLDRHVVIGNLRPYTTYCFRASHVNHNLLNGTYSAWTEIETAQSVPGTVVRFETVSVSFTLANLMWMQPVEINGVLTPYVLTIYSHGGEIQRKDSIDKNSLRYTVTDLRPATEYIFSITATTIAGEGLAINSTTTTLSLGKVTNVTVSRINSTAVKVSWNRVTASLDNDETLLYLIIYNNTRIRDGARNKTVPFNTSTTIISGLSSTGDYIYTVTVAACVNGSIVTTSEGVQPIIPLMSYQVIVVAVLVCVIVVILLPILIVGICFIIYCFKSGAKDKDSQLAFRYCLPMLEAQSDDIHAMEGEEVALWVQVRGDPLPQITWIHNGKVVDTEEEDEEGIDDSQLMLHSVQASHAGVYKFEATNNLGTIEGQIRLFVTTTGDADKGAPIRRSIQSNPIPVRKYADYLSEMLPHNHKGLREQYKSLLSGAGTHSTTAGKLSRNRNKNRVPNIIPYDDEMVELMPINSREDCQTTYINASYINGHHSSRQFIATQGPLPKTVTDFWRMVWQEGVEMIVMLVNLMEGSTIRCQQYWPESGYENYGPFRVTLTHQQQHTLYCVRLLELKCLDISDSEKRTIKHYQLTSWPKNDLPSTVSHFVSLYREVDSLWPSLDNPVLVHCGAGVGRTALFIGLRIAVEQAHAEKTVDLVSIVNKMRQQRMKMIQTEEQYIFLHNAVLEWEYCGKTAMTPMDMIRITRLFETTNALLKMNSYTAQFKALQLVSPNPNEIPRNIGLAHTKQNRCVQFLPPDSFIVPLNGDNEESDYVHASFLDGYNESQLFIIAENPLFSTTGNFWRMVVQHKCSIIVMLSDCTELGEEVCYPYWPASVNTERYFGKVRVKSVGERTCADMNEHTISVSDTTGSSVYTHTVTHLQVPNWSPSGACSNPRSIIAAINRIEVLQRQSASKHILIHCSDTVTRSGMFATLYTAIQRCKAEQTVDIYQTLKALRQQKPGLVQTTDQYKMIHELIIQFLNSFEDYTNFKDLC